MELDEELGGFQSLLCGKAFEACLHVVGDGDVEEAARARVVEVDVGFGVDVVAADAVHFVHPGAPFGDDGVQVAVHGAEADAGVLGAHVLEHLVGGGMVQGVQGIQDGAPLPAVCCHKQEWFLFLFGPLGGGRFTARRGPPPVDPFYDRLEASARRAGSWLCVGLDPDPDQFPKGLGQDDTVEFLQGIIEATADAAAAFKPNAAFFEALGSFGQDALADTIATVPPGIPVILDGKRNDIGNTARKYAEAAFDELGADAVTVTPYLGRDTVAPFAEYEDRGVFLLARTSNASAGDLQDLPTDAAGTPLWQAVAHKAMREWNPEWHNLGLVAGATYPSELTQIRALCGDGIPLLIPGVGAQGAGAAATLAAGADTHGGFALVNVGRAVMYAGQDEDWRSQVATAAAAFAADLPFR